MVDIDAEVAKLDNKLNKTRNAMNALCAKMNIPDYETKIPANVREANAAKASIAYSHTRNNHLTTLHTRKNIWKQKLKL
jgi:hypothetical protein